MNVSLTKHLEEFVECQVRVGRYNNSSEVICAALRLLEDQEHLVQANLATLKASIQAGMSDIEAGRYTVVHDTAEYAEKVKQRGRRKFDEK